jgi:hypothetical protein
MGENALTNGVLWTAKSDITAVALWTQRSSLRDGALWRGKNIMARGPPWNEMIILPIWGLLGGKNAIARGALQTGLARGAPRMKTNALTSVINILAIPVDMRGGPLVMNFLLITDLWKASLMRERERELQNPYAKGRALLCTLRFVL